MILTQDEEFVKLCKRTIGAWGVELQLRILQEECGECVAAVSHFMRGRDDARKKLASEVGDVLITALVVYNMLGGSIVDREIADKLSRLKVRLDAHDRMDDGG
jgi:NTP pyrophosphatase (non-canonical NTP hydrolase)